MNNLQESSATFHVYFSYIYTTSLKKLTLISNMMPKQLVIKDTK